MLYLKYRQGYKIDALGFQMHLNNDTEWGGSKGEFDNFDSYLRYISGLMYWCDHHGFEFHITEFDIPVNEGETNKQDIIAEKFMNLLLKINIELPELKVEIINWNLTDKNIIKSGNNTGVFDKQDKPKNFIKVMKSAIVKKGLHYNNLDRESSGVNSISQAAEIQKKKQVIRYASASKTRPPSSIPAVSYYIGNRMGRFKL